VKYLEMKEASGRSSMTFEGNLNEVKVKPLNEKIKE
jgi:hypothetical protein